MIIPEADMQHACRLGNGAEHHPIGTQWNQSQAPDSCHVEQRGDAVGDEGVVLAVDLDKVSIGI
jgi:hypothetical protein